LEINASRDHFPYGNGWRTFFVRRGSSRGMLEASLLLAIMMAAVASIFGIFTAVCFITITLVREWGRWNDGAPSMARRPSGVAYSSLREAMIVSGVACLVSVVAMPLCDMFFQSVAILIAMVWLSCGGYLVVLLYASMEASKDFGEG
jgi:hypothetical protein